MNIVKIPVHSIIDLITNSSSEVFVTADRKTIDYVKDMVNELLKAAASDKKADDLFDFKLELVEGGYGDYKVINVLAKSPENTQAAEALNKLNSAFNAEDIGNY